MESAYEAALLAVFKKIDAAIPGGLKDRIKAFVAGGAAVHFYTAYRISGDIDSTFSHRLLLPSDLEVVWVDAQGTARTLYLDKQYNDTFGLIHEDYQRDSILDAKLTKALKNIEVRFLNPVDLAVSKLSRYEAHDQEDIRELARRNLITAEAVRHRATEALQAYIGRQESVKVSIELACREIDAVQTSEPESAPATPARPARKSKKATRRKP